MYVLPRIPYLYKIADIYCMKDSVYIDKEEKSNRETTSAKKPIVIILTIATILILLLNLINTLFFY